MASPYVAPSGLEVDFDRNITKLYECITSCNWDEAIKAAQSNPDEAKTWVVRHYDEEDSEGGENEIMWRFLPLHSACARQPPADVIKALLNAYPDGAKCVDDQGMYALHYACGNQASREVVRMLLMSFPDAARLSDPRGMLPIHYLACWGPSSISVIDMVLVANRDVAKAMDEDGNTPLDLAIEGDYPESTAVVSALKRWLENSGSSTASRKVPVKSPRPVLKTVPSEEKKEQEVLRSAPSPKYAAGILTPKSANRLRQELEETKSAIQQNEQNYEGKLKSQGADFAKQIAAMEKRLNELEEEAEQGNRKIAKLEGELQDRERELHDKDGALEEKERELETKDAALTRYQRLAAERDEELERANEERDGLRQTLADLTDAHDTYKMKSEMLGDRLGSLSVSMYSMLEQQNFVLESMNAREEQWASLSDLRREKMRELVALEEKETTEGFELKQCLNKQTKEMEAIQAVIVAARNQGL